MRCLWITLADPVPTINGQLIYSKGLIDATRDAGASLSVIGIARPENPRNQLNGNGIDWRLVDEHPKSLGRRMLSRNPLSTQWTSPEMVQVLKNAIVERVWDTVVFDSICAGWALPHIMRHRGRSTIVYLSHNHEITVARRIYDSTHGLRAAQRWIDYYKVVDMERRLLAASDLVTANTPDDCQRFVDLGSRSMMFLPPGYNGVRLSCRKIDANVPRRAILVGSLDWIPKRVATEAFLTVAAEPLFNAGIDLQIVGQIKPDYLLDMRKRFPTVDFVGPVPDAQLYMQGARLALVPDLLGGFKLKGLDYVFNRLPMLAMRVGLPGMPDEAAINFDSHSAMVEKIIELIDDFPKLNQLQENAYTACIDQFDWNCIGRKLMKKMRELRKEKDNA